MALEFHKSTVSKLGKILFENIIILSFGLLFLILLFENTYDNLFKILTISNDQLIINISLF